MCKNYLTFIDCMQLCDHTVVNGIIAAQHGYLLILKPVKVNVTQRRLCRCVKVNISRGDGPGLSGDGDSEVMCSH